MIYENAINIYTDGSSFQRPRRGGMGIRYIVVNADGHEEVHDEMPAGHKEATNNEMELLACVIALHDLPSDLVTPERQRLVIFTDSQYVRNHHTSAIFTWPKQGWRSAYGRPIENVEIWKGLVREIKKAPRRVEFKWVKGHTKNVHNKAVDKLAKQSANGFLNPPLTVQSVRRKKTEQSVSLGSVLMEGQELDIRVITDKRMPQRVWRYKYEVLECDSPYVGCVDVIFSEHLLRAGHSYSVVVGENQRNPEIVEVLEEIK
ncbi:MAG: ribonuclease HI [Rhodothermales bacterium]|nr:ribonuclease HI [Rhodothermales bacterium]